MSKYGGAPGAPQFPGSGGAFPGSGGAFPGYAAGGMFPGKTPMPGGAPSALPPGAAVQPPRQGYNPFAGGAMPPGFQNGLPPGRQGGMPAQAQAQFPGVMTPEVMPPAAMPMPMGSVPPPPPAGAAPVDPRVASPGITSATDPAILAKVAALRGGR